MARYDLADFDAEAVRSSLIERHVWYARDWPPERLMAWDLGETIGFMGAEHINIFAPNNRIEITQEGSQDFDAADLQRLLGAVIVSEGVEFVFKYLSVQSEARPNPGDNDFDESVTITNIQFAPRA